jgi:putative ABC transport system permease protein
MRKDLIKYTLEHMKRKFGRNAMTIVSIMIGITAIFVLMSFGQGLQKYTNDQFQKMGVDKIIIQTKSIGPPGSSPVKFSESDYNFFEKRSEIKEIAKMIVTTVEVKHEEKDRKRSEYFYGIPTDKTQKLAEETMTFEITEGRDIKKGDDNKIIIGANYKKDNKVFKNPVRLGDKLIVNGETFTVIGFLKEFGNPDDDQSIATTMEAAKKITKRDNYDMMVARLKSAENTNITADRLTETYRKHKGQKEGKEDFYIQTFEQLLETFGSIIGVLNAILVLIAGISVLVASTNILNTLYTSVYERTKEIGILKAIGARNSDIIFIFTFEATVIGFLGGILGVILGWGLASFGGIITNLIGFGFLRPYFPIWLTIGCMLLSTVIGCLSGILPALNASKMNPVDSLRYE